MDVVLRELVRAALGRATGIRRKLLDRHRDRRVIDEYAAGRSPFGSSPGRPRASFAKLASYLSIEEPKGLGLVKEVVEETKPRETLEAEVHLLDAVVAAWRGERELVLLSFEAGIRDSRTVSTSTGSTGRC